MIALEKNKWESVYTIFDDKELKLIQTIVKKMAKESKEQGYECATGLTYFENKKTQEYIDSDKCCNKHSCIKTAKRKILKGNIRTLAIDNIYSRNDSDHDKFERCEYCDDYLNQYLTWVESELDNQYSDSKLDYNPFEVYGILESLWWCADFRIKDNDKRSSEALIAKEQWNEELKSKILKLCKDIQKETK